jgi:hypothetical protein
LLTNRLRFQADQQRHRKSCSSNCCRRS